MDEDSAGWIATLGLEPHPEGGWFRRIHASEAQVEWNGIRRPAMTAIHYLLAEGQCSAWHRVDADEAWHWQEGDAIELLQFDAPTRSLTRTRLAPVPAGDGVSCIVRAGTWQAARVLGRRALVACTVAPGFVWEGFELLEGDSAIARELCRLDALHPCSPPRANDREGT